MSVECKCVAFLFHIDRQLVLTQISIDYCICNQLVMSVSEYYSWFWLKMSRFTVRTQCPPCFTSVISWCELRSTRQSRFLLNGQLNIGAGWIFIEQLTHDILNALKQLSGIEQRDEQQKQAQNSTRTLRMLSEEWSVHVCVVDGPMASDHVRHISITRCAHAQNSCWRLTFLTSAGIFSCWNVHVALSSE